MRSLPATAIDPRRFGRRAAFSVDGAPPVRPPCSLDDVRLFALTFLGGFLFVAVYLA